MEIEKVGIGKDMPMVLAKTVKVESLEQRDVSDSEGKPIGKKLVLKVNHPDVALIELSKVKYEKNKKLQEAGTWLSFDKDGNIPSKSALASLLRKYGCTLIGDLKGKEIETVLDEAGYLVAKAY